MLFSKWCVRITYHSTHSLYSSLQAPQSHLKYVLPVLYLAYVAASHYGAPAFSEVVAVKEESVTIAEKSEKNGDVVTDVVVSETTAIVPVVESPTVRRVLNHSSALC